MSFSQKGFLMINRFIGILLLSMIISACANMPEAIEYESVDEISIQAVQQGSTSYLGKTVRWGGVITQVINNADDTWVEVLALELSDSGRPYGNRKENLGRFIAKVDKFLDPDVYLNGHYITFVGTLSEKIDGKIGNYNYSYSVVDSQGDYLWPNRTYRYYRHITPGYWYYGHSPYWNFGYGYYGYGVRYHHHGYYPYYPIFGYLERAAVTVSTTTVAHRTPGVFIPNNDIIWRSRNNPQVYTERLRGDMSISQNTTRQRNRKPWMGDFPTVGYGTVMNTNRSVKRTTPTRPSTTSRTKVSKSNKVNKSYRINK